MNPKLSSMRDEHLDTIPVTESDEVIKPSVENLIRQVQVSPRYSRNKFEVPLCNNPTSLEAFKEHSETIIYYNDDSTLSDDDSPYGENIDYVDASPPDDEIVSLEVLKLSLDLEEISSGSPTTHSELSLPDYKAFYVDNDHFKEKSSGSTTTHVDFISIDSRSRCKGGVSGDGASGLVWESMMGGGNGSEWEVDAALALILIIAAQ
ncbi:hypothetical protein Tco_0729674 [Tanacetum coccineum]|uniref:Uncharacterized protein n=1 Tax=Tanacetum coccineum TaxID=301880 RepID=A0ABQ4YT47_9ASTR